MDLRAGCGLHDAPHDGDGDAAREKVRGEGVPLWLRLAPSVRSTVLAFQRIVATRPDLGTLASMHNKFVRLALVRLRLARKELQRAEDAATQLEAQRKALVAQGKALHRWLPNC